MSFPSGRPTLSPSAVGQFFRLQSCPMYLQWEYDEDAISQIHERSWEPDTMSPVLAEEGDYFEQLQLQALDAPGRTFHGPHGADDGSGVTFETTWSDEQESGERSLTELVRSVASAPAGEDTVVHQAWMSGMIGAYEIAGKSDILYLSSTANGVRPILLEVKSTSKQKVHHRYQATIYATLLEEILAAEGIPLDLHDDESGVPTKIVTPENQIESSPDDPEGFDTAPYRVKLELKLEAGGSFDQTLLETSFDHTTNRIARRCSGCEYEPMCMTRGIESKGLELLGLQAGTQEQLHELGIHDIEDFATLFDHPDTGSVHWNYSALEPRDPHLVRRVRQEAEVANLQKRAQIAFRFLSEIDDNYGPENFGDFYPHPLRGTGNALPQDDHGEFNVDWTEWGGPNYPSGCLVRVYLYVQQDHAQDRVTLLSAIVECTFTGERREITELPATIPTSADAKQDEEDRLFSQFFSQLGTAVADVSPSWTDHSELGHLDLDSDEGFLHIFLYSDSHREALMDAIRRHPIAVWQRPLRTLLGLRDSIDQQMVSILQEDFRRRWALRFPGLGTIQSTAQFRRGEEWYDWRHSNDEDPTLPEVFATGLFDSTVRYRRTDGEIRLDHDRPRLSWVPDDMRLAQWVYPIRNREADQLPIEYLWGLRERLDPKAADDPETVYPYLYRTDNREQRITDTDVQSIAERFAGATHHIERTIETTNRFANDQFVEKQPIDLGALQEFRFDHRTLAEVCIEYQQLEYDTIRNSVEGYYAQPLDERVDSGASLVFRCTDVDEATGTIDGLLLRNDGRPYDPEEHEGLIGGPLGITDGDFMVLTRLGDSGNRPEVTRRNEPKSIGNSTTVIISNIDEDVAGTITLTAPFDNGWPYWGEYTVRHRGWSTDEGARNQEWQTYVAPGEEYVVDPMFDQIQHDRAHEALEHAGTTPVRRWLEELYAGDRQTIPIDRWEREGTPPGTGISGYLDRMAETEEFDRPNRKQADLIEDTDHGIVMLQGPPGTGKTKYTVAPAVLARVHADVHVGRGFLGVVSAVSHNAVNEALQSILELRDVCVPGPGSTPHDQAELIRICSSQGQSIDDPRVRHVYYNEDEAAEELRQLYQNFISPDAPSQNRAIFFGPPVSIRSCLNAMIRAVNELEYDNIANMMDQGDSPIFDMAVIDEASMMDLPLCLLLGSFVRENGQLLLVGDHRQMQPIQQHEWENEDREPIERHVPFLSALDFFRHLRGEEVDIDYVERNPPELDDPDATLPVHRLEETHRLPEESAQMHTDLFYNQDGIQLESLAPAQELPPVPGSIGDILDTSDRITLLVHDENGSQKTNPVEQALITELLRPLDIRTIASEIEGDEGVTAGVVVPFRAQRRDVVGLVDGVAVDTVERFQGGERDVMILSMTASNRGYISQISEFLLNPNRFNVGASRMRRKLIVIASAGVFEESSNDVSVFEQQRAWVSFYRGLGYEDGPLNEYQLSDLLSEETWDAFSAELTEIGDVQVRCYSGYDTT